MAKLIEQIYEAAVPLSKAWLVYMGFDRPDWGLKSEYEALTAAAWQRKPSGGQGSVIRDQESAHKRRAKIEASTRIELLVFVRDGLLRAYGRQWLPTPSHSLSEIPAALFDPDADKRPMVDWSTETISARGLGYEGVRIIAPTEIEELSGTVPRRRPGRPSRKPEILQAIAHYVAQDRNWLKKKRPEKRREIINYARKHFSYVEGNDPEGFSKTICDEAEKEFLSKNS